MGEVETRAGGLPPIKVFLVLAALITAGVTTYALTRDESGDQPAPLIPAGPEFAMEELNGLRIRAYEDRNLALISDLVTRDSPLKKVFSREISNLREDGVFVEIEFASVELDVISRSATQIVLEETSRQSSTVHDEQGASIGEVKGERIRVVRWTVRLEDGAWKLFDSRLVSDGPA